MADMFHVIFYINVFITIASSQGRGIYFNSSFSDNKRSLLTSYNDNISYINTHKKGKTYDYKDDNNNTDYKDDNNNNNYKDDNNNNNYKDDNNNNNYKDDNNNSNYKDDNKNTDYKDDNNNNDSKDDNQRASFNKRNLKQNKGKKIKKYKQTHFKVYSRNKIQTPRSIVKKLNTKQRNENEKKNYKKTQMFIVDSNQYDGEQQVEKDDFDDIEVNEVTGDRKELINRNSDELVINDYGDNNDFVGNDNNEGRETENVEPLQSLRQFSSQGYIPYAPLSQFQRVGPVESLNQLHRVGPAESLSQLQTFVPAQSLSQFQRVGQTESLGQLHRVGPVIPLSQLQRVGPAESVSQLQAVGPAESVSQLKTIGPVLPLSQFKKPSPVTTLPIHPNEIQYPIPIASDFSNQPETVFFQQQQLRPKQQVEKQQGNQQHPEQQQLEQQQPEQQQLEQQQAEQQQLEQQQPEQQQPEQKQAEQHQSEKQSEPQQILEQNLKPEQKLQPEPQQPGLIASSDIRAPESTSNPTVGDSLKDGLSTPFIESKMVIKTNQLRGRYVPVDAQKASEKAQLRKQQREGEKLGSLPSSNPLDSSTGTENSPLANFKGGEKNNIDNSIVKAITEEINKDSKYFVSPSFAARYRSSSNNEATQSPFIEPYINNTMEIANDKKHSDEVSNASPINLLPTEPQIKNFMTSPTLTSLNDLSNSRIDHHRNSNLKLNQFFPVETEKPNTKTMNALADSVVASQSNFLTSGHTFYRKPSTDNNGLDVEPSLSSLSPSEQHLIASIDKNVRAKLTPKLSDRILLPTKEEALTDRAVSPSEQLLDMLARGKFKDPLPEDVLNKLTNYDQNQISVNEAGIQSLANKIPERFAKVGNEYVPIHSLSINIPKETWKPPPVSEAKQLAKEESVLGKNPSYIGQNQHLLGGRRFKTILDLNNVGETVFPNHVVSLTQPIKSPLQLDFDKTPSIKYAHTTQNNIDLKQQQSMLTPGEKHDVFLLQQQHIEQAIIHARKAKMQKLNAIKAQAELQELATTNKQAEMRKQMETNSSSEMNEPAEIHKFEHSTSLTEQPPSYIQDIIHHQHEIDKTLISFQDALSDTPKRHSTIFKYHPTFHPKATHGITQHNKELEEDAQCKFNPCLNAGTCTAHPDGYRCSCKTGWNGLNCERRSNCFPSPCHHGTCSPNIESYTCTCKVGYKGIHCDVIDRCHPNPCNNKGVCTETNQNVLCECKLGFKGKLCEQEAHCLPLNPCMNGGTCHEFLDHYRCNCPSDFHGQNCEAYITPTRAPPTIPVKNVGPQAIPAPATLSSDAHSELTEPIGNLLNHNQQQSEENGEPMGLIKAINSGGPLVPHPIYITKSESGKYIGKQPFEPIAGFNIIAKNNSYEETQPSEQRDISIQDEQKLKMDSKVDSVNMNNTEETKVLAANFNHNNRYVVNVKLNDSKDLSTDEPEEILANRAITQHKPSDDIYSRNSKANQLFAHESISEYARPNSQDSHEIKDSSYYKLEKQHLKSSDEDVPRFDYLHLHEAHGNANVDTPNKDYLHIDGASSKSNTLEELPLVIKDPSTILQIENKPSGHDLSFNEIANHEIKTKTYFMKNTSSFLDTNKNFDRLHSPTQHSRTVSGSERSNINGGILSRNNLLLAHRRVNINTVANNAQQQVDNTMQSIIAAKQNADSANNNATVPQADVDDLKVVELKAKQIYAGIKAGIKNTGQMQEAKSNANNAIGNINNNIQQKMQQAKQQPQKKEINNFLERSFNRQKNAYSAWRRKALINYHKRNPLKLLPKNTVSLSKNSLCPGSCKLDCDPWCVKIGCCKPAKKVKSMFQNIENKYQNIDINKGGCASCNENADCLNNSCQCKTGFHGNGLTCSVNNCLLCHLDAECINDRCICKTGFFGDGYECKRNSKNEINVLYDTPGENNNNIENDSNEPAVGNPNNEFYKVSSIVNQPGTYEDVRNNNKPQDLHEIAKKNTNIDIDTPSSIIVKHNLNRHVNNNYIQQDLHEAHSNIGHQNSKDLKHYAIKNFRKTVNNDLSNTSSVYDQHGLHEYAGKNTKHDHHNSRMDQLGLHAFTGFRKVLCSKCHRHADCIGGDCFCKRGFYGNGNSCWPLPII